MLFRIPRLRLAAMLVLSLSLSVERFAVSQAGSGEISGEVRDPSGIASVQSGVPLALTQSTNYNSFAGFGIQRPNRISNPELPAAGRTTAEYFNTGAFTTAPQYALGNSSRNPIRGPGFKGFDLALIKRTQMTEQLNLEFRTEIFNFTNTPPLGSPNVVYGTAGFGSITSAGDPRVIQFALKLHY